jgi:hypothetical protein
MTETEEGSSTMVITETNVTKMVITGVPNLDPVAVYLEDQGPERGKVTITCFGKSWTHFWGAMGKGTPVRAFLLHCDKHYLAGKFSPGTNPSEEDLDKLEAHAREHICKRRRDNELKADTARKLYDATEGLVSLKDCDTTEFNFTMYQIFGDEWWYSIPARPNPEYEYLCRIINTVKAALRSAGNGVG